MPRFKVGLLVLVMLMTTSVSVYAAEPWEGIWGVDRASCTSGKSIGEEEGAPIRITRREITGLENSCRIQRVVRTGPAEWTITSSCFGEGNTYTVRDSYAMLGPDRLRKRGRDRATVDYVRCSSAPGYFVHDASLPDASLKALPSEIVRWVQDVQQQCIVNGGDLLRPTFGQGVVFTDIDDNGGADILIDARDLCGEWIKGGNCSNRGCDLKIWRQSAPNVWTKVFDEHLHRNFLSFDEARRLRLMVVSIHAGDRRCKPSPGRDYSSGEKCDLIVSFQGGRWVWKKIE